MGEAVDPFHAEVPVEGDRCDLADSRPFLRLAYAYIY